MKAVFNNPDNKTFPAAFSGKNNRFPSKLTIGKSYDVISEARRYDGYTYYLVLCDDGVERNILGNKFISTEDYREQMLNKILKRVQILLKPMKQDIEMKVVCIDNNNTSTETITSYKFITLGKSYDAIKLTPSKLTYDIICDDDVVRSLLTSRFITLEVHREQMLNKILK
jgi:hypothetical protein